MNVRASLWLSLLLGASSSCSLAEPLASLLPREPPPTAKPRPAERTLFLNEPFKVAQATCCVSSAKSTLVESATPPYPTARVRPDVRALELSLQCEDARGAPLGSQRALPHDSVVLLVLSRGKTLAPRPGDLEHDRLVFDLPDGVDPELPTSRRFAADTGMGVIARERAVAKLALSSQASSLQVELRQRYQDAALDTLVDQLARALASQAGLTALARDADAELALTQLAQIYDEVRKRFQPARLELSRLSAGAKDARSITLSLTRPRNRGSSFEVARFELSLAENEAGLLRVKSFDNREAARNALACDALERALQSSLVSLEETERKPRIQTPRETCNALGLLVPRACGELSPVLLARALEVGVRCRQPFDSARTSKQALPGDFQITLRRGRPARGLDQSPRYVVSLFHAGQVVFHGKHWVESQERSDGRTDLSLLAGLYEHIQGLDFFARRGGEYDLEHCQPSDDQGDVMTVVAANRQRMVLNRDGCRGPFSEGELLDLRKRVERVAGISAWTQKGGVLADQDAEQWAIAE
jgi:hypothetical protein